MNEWNIKANRWHLEFGWREKLWHRSTENALGVSNAHTHTQGRALAKKTHDKRRSERGRKMSTSLPLSSTERHIFTRSERLNRISIVSYHNNNFQFVVFWFLWLLGRAHESYKFFVRGKNTKYPHIPWSCCYAKTFNLWRW